MAYWQKINIVILIGLIACVLTSLLRLTSDKKSNKDKINLPERTVFTGLNYTEYLENEKVFSFKIGSIEVLRRKIGFFRLGFYKIAKIENVCLNFYKVDNPNSRDKLNLGLSFKKFLSSYGKKLGYDIKRLIGESIRGIEIEKIRINIYNGVTLLSSISSDKAQVDFGKKEVIFKGNVKIASILDRLLECERIRWAQETDRFKTKGSYRLRIKDKIIKGKELETDYLLAKVKI